MPKVKFDAPMGTSIARIGEQLSHLFDVGGEDLWIERSSHLERIAIEPAWHDFALAKHGIELAAARVFRLRESEKRWPRLEDLASDHDMLALANLAAAVFACWPHLSAQGQ